MFGIKTLKRNIRTLEGRIEALKIESLYKDKVKNFNVSYSGMSYMNEFLFSLAVDGEEVLFGNYSKIREYLEDLSKKSKTKIKMKIKSKNQK